MNERHMALLEYITQHGKTEVGVLADYLKTSQVTVRKDLDVLAERGMLKRERGYALPNDPGDINYRMGFRYERKLRIAQAAAACVQDGEMIMVESGSTCAVFAEELARTKKNVTLITNSVYIANYIKDYTNVQIVLLGGTMQPKSQSLVGPLTKEGAKAFRVDKIFIGTDGYSRESGFTGDDLTRSDTLSAMIDSAAHAYVLTDSDKFKHPGSVSFLRLEDVYEVITDEDILPKEEKYLKEQGIIVTMVAKAPCSHKTTKTKHASRR